VQTAVDNAGGWVFVGPGTFNESVDISTAGLTLEGVGDGSIIDGGTIGYGVVISASNVTIRNLTVQTTGGSGNTYHAIRTTTGGDSSTIDNVYIPDSDAHGVWLESGSDHTVKNCVIENTDERGVYSTTLRTICVNNKFDTTGQHAVFTSSGSDDCIISNNIFTNCQPESIKPFGSDTLVGGNRIMNTGSYGILNEGTDNIIFNNRISDSGISDFLDNGTGTVTDGNLTGASN
jgi:nitrous oxidase accessory protein NosD